MIMNENKSRSIAIIIPCYNEELTIGKVIDDFRISLPHADIFVFDNNSTDGTRQIAKEKGVSVLPEFRQGKGNVVRSAFRQIDSDICIMIDGDDTYPADKIHELLEPVFNGEADMVVGDRLSGGEYERENKRPLHTFGNRLVIWLINKLFGANLKDIMSGYRVFGRKFVKNFPVNSGGFEIETEMTLHALDKKFLIKEVPVKYRDRPEGSFSKLDTFGDGFRVLKTILWVFKDYKPLLFFSLMSMLFFVLGLLIGLPVVLEFMKTGLVLKIPSAILAMGLMMISVVSLFSGFILDTIVKHHRENYELWLNRQDM